MVDLSTLKKINKVGLLEYLLPNYKINKWIFRITFIFFTLWIFLGMYDNFNYKTLTSYPYLECPKDSRFPCTNPFYEMQPCPIKETYVCNQKNLFPGETYGKKPNFFADQAYTFTFLIFTIAFFVNHFLYNKGYKIPER